MAEEEIRKADLEGISRLLNAQNGTLAAIGDLAISFFAQKPLPILTTAGTLYMCLPENRKHIKSFLTGSLVPWATMGLLKYGPIVEEFIQNNDLYFPYMS